MNVLVKNDWEVDELKEEMVCVIITAGDYYQCIFAKCKCLAHCDYVIFTYVNSAVSFEGEKIHDKTIIQRLMSDRRGDDEEIQL